MLPFDAHIVAGKPAFEQVIAAVHRAFATGRLKAGDAFPSVREISREIGINPNTAHKAVAVLVAEGLLEIRPGLGTRVAERAPGSPAERAKELVPLVDELVVQARKLGASPEEIAKLVAARWDKFAR